MCKEEFLNNGRIPLKLQLQPYDPDLNDISDEEEEISEDFTD